MMNRIPMVAGNWKMYKNISEARHLVSEMIPGLQMVENVEKVICPPFTALLAVRALLEGSDIGLGAQDMYWESAGAFTGEISPLMLSELCHYVIIGHSERRSYFGETNQTVNKKLHAALSHGLFPIVCVGETLEENQAHKTHQVITSQLHEGFQALVLDRVEDNGQVPFAIAYEPVWAIGTGQAASPEGANTVVKEIVRPALTDMFGEKLASMTRVLYGGSVKANNASDFFVQSDIDGALVGGACLKVEEFIPIVQAAA